MIYRNNGQSYIIELEIDGVVTDTKSVTTATAKATYHILLGIARSQKRPWAIFIRIRKIYNTHPNLIKRKKQLQNI